jgi:hypothetical protein
VAAPGMIAHVLRKILAQEIGGPAFMAIVRSVIRRAGMARALRDHHQPMFCRATQIWRPVGAESTRAQVCNNDPDSDENSYRGGQRVRRVWTVGRRRACG